jgi:hypothetical protein
MRRLIAVLAIAALPLGGCAEFQKFETTVSNAVGYVASTKVNSKDAYIAINVFNAAERAVTAYLQLPPCGTGHALCRKDGAAAALDQPFTAGIIARNNLRAFMKANPGTLADAGLYNTLTSATKTLQSIMDVYGIGSTK